MNGRLNWKDVLVLLGLLVAIIGSQWRFSSNLSARMDRLEDRIKGVEQELSDQGKALARIEGRLDPYTPPEPVNGG